MESLKVNSLQQDEKMAMMSKISAKQYHLIYPANDLLHHQKMTKILKIATPKSHPVYPAHPKNHVQTINALKTLEELLG